MLERLFALETFGVKLGLANITALCERLGHPERAFASVHIAGTNGKGSVAAMVHAGLVAAGIPAGRYTSPHLADLTERFVLDRAAVEPSELGSVADTVLDAAEYLVREGTLPNPPTFFEATTAIAFEIFRRHRVQVAVIEVGLGGRFDATNVIVPKVAAITSIAFDHEAQLGRTLESIAYEKAGIIKEGVPVVTGPLPPAAAAMIARVAGAQHAALLPARQQVGVSARTMVDGRACLNVTTDLHQYHEVALALRGEHQIDNARVAIAVLETLKNRGFAIPFPAIARGLAQADWPGRLELLELGGGRRVLMDAAHNADGAAALARHLAAWHPSRPALVFGAMRDKDVAGMLRALAPVVGRIIATSPANARAEQTSTIAAAVRALDPARDVVEVPGPMMAVEEALRGSAEVCVAGSIFLIGEVRDPLRRRAILP